MARGFSRFQCSTVCLASTRVSRWACGGKRGVGYGLMSYVDMCLAARFMLWEVLSASKVFSLARGGLLWGSRVPCRLSARSGAHATCTHARTTPRTVDPEVLGPSPGESPGTLRPWSHSRRCRPSRWQRPAHEPSSQRAGLGRSPAQQQCQPSGSVAAVTRNRWSWHVYNSVLGPLASSPLLDLPERTALRVVVAYKIDYTASTLPGSWRNAQ